MAILPLLLVLTTGQVWTVDDDHPADFASIQAAIDDPQVLDGDRLLVHPGSYGSFALDKALQIVAPADQRFTVENASITGVPEFEIAGMHAKRLYVRGVPGRGRIDDCIVGWEFYLPPQWFLMYAGTTELVDCAQLVVTRSTFHGTDGCYPYLYGSDDPCVRLRRTTAAFVDCGLWGGWEDVCDGHPTSDGSPALEAYEGSDVTLAGCRLEGGQGTGVTAGYPAIRLDASVARVRGSSPHFLMSGYGVPEVGAFGGGNGSSATVSGVQVVPPSLPAWVSVPDEPEPWIRVLGRDAPGGTVTVEVYGPVGTTGVIGFSHAPVLQPTPFGPLWVARSALRRVRLATIGQDLPVSVDLPLAGVGSVPGDPLDLQAFFRQPPHAAVVLTNPTHAILRW